MFKDKMPVKLDTACLLKNYCCAKGYFCSKRGETKSKLASALFLEVSERTVATARSLLLSQESGCQERSNCTAKDAIYRSKGPDHD